MSPRRTHLLEADVLGVLAETLTAEVHVVLADQPVVVGTRTAVWRRHGMLVQITVTELVDTKFLGSKVENVGLPATRPRSVLLRVAMPDIRLTHLESVCPEERWNLRVEVADGARVADCSIARLHAMVQSTGTSVFCVTRVDVSSVDQL